MRITAKILAAAASAAMLCPAISMTAHADGSIEDVCNAIREIGFTEAYVQQFMNTYQTLPHDDEGMEVEGVYDTYANWAEYIEIYQKKITEKLSEALGIDPEAVKTADPSAYMPQFTAPATTAAQTTAPAAVQTDENGSTVSQTTAASAQQTTAVTDANAGGHTKEDEDAFVKMTLEEKKEFLSSLPEDQRTAYIAGLTPAERRSLLKQVGTEVQADIIKDFVDAGETLGMHVSVDKIENGQIDYSVRNGEGTLVDSSSLGNTVDDTGWDLTLPVLGSAGTILLSVGGLGWTALRANKRRDEVLHGEDK